MKSLAESVKARDRPEMPDVPSGDRARTKEALIGVIKNAVGALQAKSPGEAEGYKAWLASVAARVSQASKEGGFLGIGGTPVSPDEDAALKQLSEVLGVKAPMPTRP